MQIITKSGAQYLLTKYATLFSLSKEDRRYILIHNISQALHAVRDGVKSNPSIDELKKDLEKVEFRRQFSKLFDEDIKDIFYELVDDLFDDNLEIKATHILPFLQMQQTRRKEDAVNSITAGENFKLALGLFLQSPDPENKEKLISASSTIYKSVVHEQGFDADNIIANLNKILKRLVKDTHINVYQKNLLETLIKDLGKAGVIIKKGMAVNIRENEQEKDVTAFHALNLVFSNYLIPDFKRNSLKEITQNFLDELEKLEKAGNLIEQKNLENSFFFNSEDTKNIRERKRIIENIFNPFSDEIIDAAKEKGSLKNNEQHFDFIDKLSEKECDIVIYKLMDNIRELTTQDKDILKIHSINDKWIFNWFMKLVKVIEEIFNIKTTSEELLEEIDSKINGLNPYITSDKSH